MTALTPTGRKTVCRYLYDGVNRCTAESLWPDGEVRLCTTHTAAVIAAVNAQATALRNLGKATR